jgi:hypothetical protein
MPTPSTPVGAGYVPSPTTSSGGGGQVQVCTTVPYTLTTDVSVPVVTVKTFTSSIAAQTTQYFPYTTVSTVNVGGVESSISTATITSIVYQTSVYSYETYIESPTVIVSSTPPLLTTIVGSSASVWETYYPTLSYATCTVFTISKSTIPTASVSCGASYGQY